MDKGDKTMKARVKATGDIFEISDTTTIYPEHYDKSYNITEVEFLDVKENAFPKVDDPNYWTRLEHQYAGMAMQGMLSNTSLITVLFDATKDHDELLKEVVICSHEYAHALVEKMKEERK